MEFMLFPTHHPFLPVFIFHGFVDNNFLNHKMIHKLRDVGYERRLVNENRGYTINQFL